MTRKRFIKLLMSQGYSRNTASTMADIAIRNRVSYLDAYLAKDCTVNSLSSALDTLSNVVCQLSKALGVLTSAVSIGIEAGVRAYHEASESTFEGKCPRCGGTGIEPRMQSMAQIGGPSLRGPDSFSICTQCFGTGKYKLYE